MCVNTDKTYKLIIVELPEIEFHFAPIFYEIFSEIYQKIISKQLKKTIKVWSRRDKKLKANCKIPGRHILL
ncbi:hypothetical protein T12_8873, partial [Trichinella patagoniensis]